MFQLISWHNVSKYEFQVAQRRICHCKHAAARFQVHLRLVQWRRLFRHGQPHFNALLVTQTSRPQHSTHAPRTQTTQHHQHTAHIEPQPLHTKQPTRPTITRAAPTRPPLLRHARRNPRGGAPVTLSAHTHNHRSRVHRMGVQPHTNRQSQHGQLEPPPPAPPNPTSHTKHNGGTLQAP